MAGLVRKWIPLTLMGVLLLRMSLAAAAPLRDPDVWWHLRLGEEFRGGWSFLHPEQLSELATVRWAPTQWLPEIVAYQVQDLFGLPGVAWLFGAALVFVVIAVYAVCRQSADILPAVLATGLALGAATASLSPRPQLLSFAFLAITVGAWLRAAETGKPPWPLVALSWVWAMCHGMWFTGALVGVGVVIAMVLERKHPIRQIALAGSVPVLSIVVAALTPAGPRLLLSPFAVGERRTMITEWQPAAWNDGPVLVVAAMVIALGVLFLRRRPSWAELALIAMAVIWTATSARTVALSGVILAPVVAARVQEVIGERARVSRGEQVGIGTAAVACLAIVAVLVPQTADEPDDVPLALDSQLAALPDGTRVLNTWTLGGWLEWRHRNLEPVVDGLADAYSVEHLRGYIGTLELRPGWPEYVAETGVTAALLAPEDARLADALRDDLGWQQLGQDDATVLLVAP